MAQTPAAPHAMCFLDIAIDNENVGRIEIELNGDTPITSENFRCLCTGEKGETKNGVPLHYKGSVFHRIIPGFMCQGGDFERSNGTGGESIYGEKFNDENFNHKHVGAGCLSMANAGPNFNSSQFFITFGDMPHIDGKHVVFGKVTAGEEVYQAIEKAGSEKGAVKAPVTIVDCGQIEPQPILQE